MNSKNIQLVLAAFLIFCMGGGYAAQSTGNGPMAAAGALYSLGQRGFPNLSNIGANPPESVAKIGQILSTPKYMDNGLEIGQATAFPLQGIERYIRSRGYTSGYLKFQGIRPCPQPYSAGICPQLNWICHAVGEKAAGCVLIGYYAHDTKKDLYKRLGGKWVTILGWQHNTTGRGCPIVLSVSDPATGKQAWLYFEQIKSGQILQSTIDGKTLTVISPADGLYKVSSSLSLGSTSIFDGAILIRM